MRRSWLIAALAAGMLAVAGCGEGADDTRGTASAEQTCSAAEQAMTELSGSLEAALLAWDGTPEKAGEITAVTDQWAGKFRDLAAGSADPELRAMLEDLAAQLDEFGASWQEGGGGDPSLLAEGSAVQPLAGHCGFGAALGRG